MNPASSPSFRSGILYFCALPLILGLSACTTIENRRDLYFPQTVQGPYTKMLHSGIPKRLPVRRLLVVKKGSDGKNVIPPQNPSGTSALPEKPL